MENLTSEDIDNISNTVARFDELALASKGFMEKLDEIERNLNYKRFYFPGNEIKLYVEGSGTDDVNTHYVNTLSSPYWDPRYINEYITKAKMYRYDRHVIYYNPFINQWESKNYGQLEQILTDYYDYIEDDIKNKESITSIEEENYKNAISSVLASLIYFNKLEDFINYTGYKWIRNIQSKYKSKINYYKNQIRDDLTLQTEDDFQLLDYGFLASKSLAFDADKELAEYLKYENEYKEYKEKLWELLSNVKNLQLCASSISGIQQASGTSSITMNQMISCIQDMREEKLNSNNETPTDTSAETPTDTPVEVPVEKTEIPIEDMIEENNEPEKDNKTIKIIIIISVVVVSCIIVSLIIYFIIKSRTSSKILDTTDIVS